jgi:hypothetical protein
LLSDVNRNIVHKYIDSIAYGTKKIVEIICIKLRISTVPKLPYLEM